MIDLNIKAEKILNYTKRFVAFLDVLGFTKMVFNDNKKINKYFGLIEDTITQLKEIENKKEIESIIISDSVILSIQYEEFDKEDKLRHLCIAVGLIQQQLVSNDIMLRGGISFGETYFDSKSNQIVGKGYINAYQLEEHDAIFPRVVLDLKLINEFKLNNATELIALINKKDEGGLTFNNWKNRILFDWKENVYSDLFHIEQDFPLFIDYLHQVTLDPKNLTQLELIIKNIEKNIYEDRSIYIKLKWVKNYLLTSLNQNARNHKNPDFKSIYSRIESL